MSVPKVQAFVDGENLVMRYQAMVDAGANPREGVVHVPNSFVWHPDVTTWSCFDMQRVTYYTSASGDQQNVADLRKRIAGTHFDYSHEFDHGVPQGSAQLVPKVFHKITKSQKTRNVDINIVIDMMRAAHTSSVELLLLLSGDGDYLPVIEECMRQGKTVWAMSFSSGLNQNIPTSVDLYVDLDDIFFA